MSRLEGRLTHFTDADSTLTWDDLGGTVTVTHTASLDPPFINASENSFTEPDATGTFSMSVTPVDNETSTFDPSTWSGGGTAGLIQSTNSGWGLTDSTSNANLQSGEAFIVEFDLNSLTLGAGDTLVLLGAGLNTADGEIWMRTGASSGVEITTTQTISHGDMFALVNPTATPGRLQTLTLDIVVNPIPEPGTLGFAAIAGMAMILIRQRRG